LVEHVIRNDGVTGSSPVCGTTLFSNIAFAHHSDAAGQRSLSGLPGQGERARACNLLLTRPF